MNIRPRIRNAALVGAFAALAATAWATNESISSGAWIPIYNNTAAERPVATSAEPIAVNDSLSPSESVVAASEAVAYENHAVAIPALADRSVAQPGITVEERRLSLDERLQAAVMDKLANNSRLSGKIGVESHDAVVTLSGYTSTVGQAQRAGRDAGSIVGVKYVQNQIRPRVGGSV
jgi:hypothetical protein